MKSETLCKRVKAPIHEALCILSPQYATTNPRIKGVNSATTRIQSEKDKCYLENYKYQIFAVSKVYSNNGYQANLEIFTSAKFIVCEKNNVTYK